METKPESKTYTGNDAYKEITRGLPRKDIHPDHEKALKVFRDQPVVRLSDNTIEAIRSAILHTIETGKLPERPKRRSPKPEESIPMADLIRGGMFPTPGVSSMEFIGDHGGFIPHTYGTRVRSAKNKFNW